MFVGCCSGKKRKNRVHIEPDLKKQGQEKAKRLSKKLLSRYAEALEAMEQKYVESDELRQIYNKEKQKAIRAYENSEGDIPEEAIEEYEHQREYLEEQIEELFEQAKESNNRNRKNIEYQLSNFYRQLSDDYVTNMQKVAEQTRKANMNKLHQEFVSSVISELSSSIPYANILQSAKADCRDRLNKDRTKVGRGKDAWESVADGATAAANSPLANTFGFVGKGLGALWGGITSVATADQATDVVLADFKVYVSRLPSIGFLRGIDF